MALTVASSSGLSEAAIAEASAPTEATIDCDNDAFSFWKLPENLRGPLAQEAKDSHPLIQRFLFEEYLSPDRRLPSALLMKYYRVKKFIPAPLRHWINFAAVRTRPRDRFPNWPCEAEPRDRESFRSVAYRILARGQALLHFADPRRRKPARLRAHGADGRSRGALRIQIVVESAAGAVSHRLEGRRTLA